MTSEQDELAERGRVLAEIERRMSSPLVLSELNYGINQEKQHVDKDKIAEPIFKDFEITKNEIPDFMNLVKGTKLDFLKDLNNQLGFYVEESIRNSKAHEQDVRQLLLSEIEAKLRSPGVMSALSAVNQDSTAHLKPEEERIQEYMKALESVDLPNLNASNQGLRIFIDNGLKLKEELTSADIAPYARSNQFLDWKNILENGFSEYQQKPDSIRGAWNNVTRPSEQESSLRLAFNKGDDYKVVTVPNTRLGSGVDAFVSEAIPVAVKPSA